MRGSRQVISMLTSDYDIAPKETKTVENWWSPKIFFENHPNALYVGEHVAYTRLFVDNFEIKRQDYFVID